MSAISELATIAAARLEDIARLDAIRDLKEVPQAGLRIEVVRRVMPMFAWGNASREPLGYRVDRLCGEAFFLDHFDVIHAADSHCVVACQRHPAGRLEAVVVFLTE